MGRSIMRERANDIDFCRSAIGRDGESIRSMGGGISGAVIALIPAGTSARTVIEDFGLSYRTGIIDVSHKYNRLLVRLGKGSRSYMGGYSVVQSFHWILSHKRREKDPGRIQSGIKYLRAPAPIRIASGACGLLLVLSGLFGASSRDIVSDAALRYRIPESELRALIAVESSGNSRALSRSGAVGLTQLMPATAAWHCGIRGRELWNPVANVNCGASYYAYLRRRYGCPVLAIAAYHSGPGAVDRNRFQVPQRSIRHVRKWLAAQHGIVI